ncbi:MAG: hypothetical protein ACLFVS_03130 [Candidatus Acetothermia bacterium]
MGRKSYEQNPADRKELQELCYKLYFKNPLAGNIIDNYMFYTLGKDGVEVIWEDSRQAKERWEKVKARNQWASLSKDIARMTFLTGEDFVGVFPRGGELKVDMRQFHPTDVSEINHKQGDPLASLEYVVTGLSGDEQVWLESEMTHFKVRDVGPVSRGRPVLERVIEALAWYHSFLEDRTNMMRVRSRLPIIRYVEGKPEGVPVKSLPEPNTVLDESNANEWKFPELNMSSYDVAKDARELKLYIATGVSLPEYMCYYDASNANYSSTVVTESTPISLFKHLQGKLRPTYRELIKKVMPAFADEQFRISFPEVDLRNFDKKVEAVITEFQNGLRSRKSSQIALDLDPELQDQQMKQELGPLETEEDLRRVVESVLFHYPAVRDSGGDRGALSRLARAFEKRGWLD